MMPKSKICTKCKVEKPLDQFYKLKIGKFGRASQCMVCAAKYYRENREKILEQRRRYYEENHEKISEWRRRYYEENREKLLEQSRRYRDKYLKN